MINIDGYIFSDKLEELYNDVQKLKPESKIIIEIIGNSTELDRNIDGFQETLLNGDINIKARNNENIESILSHELLHAYFLRKGYPNHHYVLGENNAIFHFGRDLYNHVIHKLILEEQLKRGFDVKWHQKTLAEGLGKDVDKEWRNPKDIVMYSMIILLCDILCGDYKEIYKKEINSKFPKADTISKKLYNSIMEEDFKTPYETRKAIVRVYKRFNNILKSYKLPNLNLSENVVITYIPSDEELSKKVLKVFHICKEVKYVDGVKFWLLKSNIDEQSSFIIATRNREYPEIRELLFDMTLKELFEDSNCIISVD